VQQVHVDLGPGAAQGQAGEGHDLDADQAGELLAGAQRCPQGPQADPAPHIRVGPDMGDAVGQVLKSGTAGALDHLINGEVGPGLKPGLDRTGEVATLIGHDPRRQGFVEVGMWFDKRRE
jgi:hypothetical protein